MGYFSFGAINFIYKIYRSKKFRKFLIGFGFLAFVLFTIFNNTTFAAETTVDADTTGILTQQIQYNNDMIALFDGCIHTLESGSGTVVNNSGNAYTLESFQALFRSYFANNPSFRNGWFYGDSSTNGLWFQSWSSVTGQQTISHLNGSPSMPAAYNFYIGEWERCTSIGWTFYIKITSTGYQCDFYFNTSHEFYVPYEIYAEGNTQFEGVNVLSQSGVGLIAHVWDYFMSGNVLNDNIGVINTNQEINESVTETNDFLNQDSTTGVVDDITNTISDDTTDITEDGFNSIFTTIRDGLINGSNYGITFNIPFTNQSIYLSINNIYGSYANYLSLYNSTLGVIIRNCWSFVFGLYVYKDIGRIIRKVKSGNIEGVETENIKEDLL